MTTLIIFLAKSGPESLLVGIIVGAITMIFLAIVSGIKKATKNIGSKKKDAHKIDRDSRHLE